MARGTPDLRKGTIGAAASGVWEAVYTAIETTLTAYQTAAVDAWEIHDTVDATPATRNMVYVSRGDRNLVAAAGDTRIYVQLQRRTNAWAKQEINFSLYQYWDDATNTGYNATSYQYGSSTLLASASTVYINDTDSVSWWAAGNEYEYIFILKQGGNWQWIQFGQPDRAFVSPAYSGVAFTSGAETAGAGVVIDIDRDLTGLVTDGQKIWIVDAQGGTGASEITTMTTFTAGAPDTVTMDLANNYAAGAIIGWDPCPMILSGDPSGGTASGKSWYTCLDASATGTGITVATSNTNSGATTWRMDDNGLMIPGVATTSQWDEQYQDPSPLSDLYMGTKVMFNQFTSGSNPNQGKFPRGGSDIISYWAHGTQVDEDIMQANNDANQSWRVFPSLPADSGTILGIGGGTIIP